MCGGGGGIDPMSVVLWQQALRNQSPTADLERQLLELQTQLVGSQADIFESIAPLLQQIEEQNAATQLERAEFQRDVFPQLLNEIGLMEVPENARQSLVRDLTGFDERFGGGRAEEFIGGQDSDIRALVATANRALGGSPAMPGGTVEGDNARQALVRRLTGFEGEFGGGRAAEFISSQSPDTQARVEAINQLAREGVDLRAAEEGTAIVRRPLTEIEQLEEDVRRRRLERENLALEGKLPVPEALNEELSSVRARVENELVADFGSMRAARKSSAGQARLAELNRTETLVTDAARRGEISTLAGLNLATRGAAESEANVNFAQTSSLTGSGNNPAAQLMALFPAMFGATQAPQNVALSGILNAQQFNASQPDVFGSLLGLVAGAAGGKFGSSLGGRAAAGIPFFG